jgi:hypothetical protein
VKGRPPVTSRESGLNAQSAIITAATVTRISDSRAASTPQHAYRLEALPAHIASRIEFDPATSEWIWSGRTDRDGYGRLGSEGAHRIVYRLLVGPIPPKKVLDHAKRLGCTTRHDCVSWWHLEPVTHRQNVLRGTSFAAVNYLKTHCGRCGEPFDLFNCYTAPSGRRDCRACGRRRAAEYMERVKAGQPVRRRRDLGQAA